MNGLKITFFSISLVFVIASCSPKNMDKKEEQISVAPDDSESPVDSLFNSVKGNIAFSQLSTTPNSVILTGMASQRLVTVYKSSGTANSVANKRYYYDYDGSENEVEEHFMPGIDILFGYNLLNIAHYDLKTEKLNYMFQKPSLIKTLYYPAFEQDSINKIPVNRNYYLVSVYDEDTNKDTLINRHDLRRFYLFDSTCVIKTPLIPSDYSVVRSQYDSQNDMMYLFAKHDDNKNGEADKVEPVSIFWINLKAPQKAKRLY